MFFYKITCKKDRFIYNITGDDRDYLINLIKKESPPHKHKNYEIIVYTRGEGILHTNKLELAKMLYNNRFSNHEYVVALISAFTHFLLGRINIENGIYLAIKNIIDEITDNFYCYDIDLCSVLKKSGYSEDYIRAQFKKATGKMPTEFLTETRISHACYLIDTYRKSIPLTAISEQCGYVDYIYFSRRFKQLTGTSPRKYMEDDMNFE